MQEAEGRWAHADAPISILDLSFLNAKQCFSPPPNVKSGPTGSDPEVGLISVDCYTLAQTILDLCRPEGLLGCIKKIGI